MHAICGLGMRLDRIIDSRVSLYYLYGRCSCTVMITSAFLQHLVSRVSTVWASQWNFLKIFSGWQASHSYIELFQWHIKQIGNDKLVNVVIGRMEWPFLATVHTSRWRFRACTLTSDDRGGLWSGNETMYARVLSLFYATNSSWTVLWTAWPG